MPISTKLVAVAASAAVLMTGAGVAIGATQGQAPTVAAVPVITSTEVRVWADDTTYSVSLPSATVAEALQAAGITLSETDRVSPTPETPLATGDVVTVNRVAVTQETREVTLEFSTTEVKDGTLAKGERTVKTKGANGTRQDVVEVVTVDGAEESATTLSETVTQEPVTQVVHVGTKVAPQVTSRSATRTSSGTPAKKASTPAPAASAGNTSSAGLNLANAAMWDRIAQCESTGRWNINTGNGYYGGLQFNLGTWRSVNGTDFAAYPHQATREQQITVANRLYAQRGLQPWGCRHAA